MAELSLFNVLLMLLGPFLVIGLPGLIALAQWPVPASSRPRTRRPVFGAPQMAGARW